MDIYKEQKFNKDLSRREILKYGLYGSLILSLSTCLWFNGCSKQQRRKKPNIILITLDTTRVDHLSCYGYYRSTTPNLDKLALESVRYTRAIATSSWTLPSHVSLFTGKFTSSHGARYDPEGSLCLMDAIRGPEAWDDYRARGLSDNELTLAEILKKNGYATGAVIGGPWMKRFFGLNKGFDFYDDSEISTVNGRLAKQVTDSAVKWIKKFKEKEFFLFLNYFDPHFPYMPPEGYAWAFMPKDINLNKRKMTTEEINALYDAEILYMDYYIGQLMQILKTYNLYDNTWIILTADHGELLGEHEEFRHGKYLYQEEIRIPLLMKYPGKESASEKREIRIVLPENSFCEKSVR